MGKLSVQDKVGLIVCLALMLMYSNAEQQYFTPNQTSSWNEARNHCQQCFTELVTLTHTNIRDIIQMVSSESWIGLRKNINSSSMAWSQWANGDPLIFQNWYPGYPDLNPSQPEKDCCGSTCPCPEKTTYKMTTSTPVMTYNNTSSNYAIKTNTDSTYATNTKTSSHYAIKTNTDSTYATNPNTDSTYATNPNTDSTYATNPNTDSTYATNPNTVSVKQEFCVATLSFGAWINTDCSKPLRFICYEDAVIANINVTEVTSNSVNFIWARPPGNISHYRIHLQSDTQERTENHTDFDELMFGFDNLTDGTRYFVQVFPVRCGRDLQSQNATFYTPTFKVMNLTAINVTDTSVYLNWSEPNGKVDFYRINYRDQERDNSTVGIQIDNLIPGHNYTFTVRSGVRVGLDGATLSKSTLIIIHTKPGKVTNLKAYNNNVTSLMLSWDKPAGNYSNFIVTAVNDSNINMFNQTEDGSPTSVWGLQVGAKILLSVTALANIGGSILKGEAVSLVSYTIPEPISNLVLEATHDNISARWDPPVGNYTAFRVELKLSEKIIKTDNVTTLKTYFDQLKSGAKYTVIVKSLSGPLVSTPVHKSQLTRPEPPTNLSVNNKNKTYMSFKWNSPVNSEAAHYFVRVTSIFWGWEFNTTVNTTRCEVGPLFSGTKYSLQVQTKAENLSTPVNITHTTG
ncbi:fibronectin [Scomber scombrus]|uniref:Fibronectin n=1 Tax=Scomber scombrus TaxID=13677 RepID=A0AAV1N0C6_SCOSC